MESIHALVYEWHALVTAPAVAAVEQVPAVVVQVSPRWTLGVLKVNVSCVVAGTGVALTGAAVASLWMRWKAYCSHMIRSAYSWMVSRCSTHANYGRRRLFLDGYRHRDMPAKTQHGHARAAGNRTGADYCINDYIYTTGKEPYDIAGASRNVSEGSRLYYMAKDYHIDFRDDKLGPGHILKMVDVDYYLDVVELENWLRHGNPLVLYTFTPITAGGSTTEGSFTIADNRVRVVHHGGARYEHELWNWDVDTITIDTWAGVWICAVDSVQVAVDRKVVQVTPQVWVPAPLSRFVPRCPLRRRDLTKSSGGRWARILTVKKDGVQYASVARSGSDYAVTLPAAALESMRVRHIYSKSQRNVGDIQAQLDLLVRKELADLEPAIAAPLLYEYFESDAPPLKVIPQVLGAVAPHYQPVEPLVLDHPRYYARAVGPAVVVGGALFPAISRNSEALTIADRVRVPRNTVIPPGRYRSLLNEFITNLVPDLGGITPMSVAEVMADQARPTQKARNEHARMWLYSSRTLVRAFQKREVVHKYKAARNISTLPVDLNLRYSCYTRPFKEAYLKHHAWYVPGKSPPTIAASVQSICRQSNYVVSTDFTNLDGSKSPFLRDVYRECLLRAYGADPPLVATLERMTNPRAVTMSGLEYDPGPSQLSGASDTTDNNTVAVAFYLYSAFRSSGYSREEAWERMECTLVCGDDVLAVIPPDTAVKTAEELGLSLKVDEVAIGQPVSFLGRVFVDPWSTATSVQDPKRTMAKIHCTVSDAQRVTPEVALRWKCVGYLANDAQTPLISHYCRAVLRSQGVDPTVPPLLSEAPEAVLADLPWWARAVALGYVEGGTWPNQPSERMWAIVANSMGVTEAELRQYCDGLDGLTDLTQLVPLVTMEVDVQVRAVESAGGSLVEPEGVTVQQETARIAVNNGSAATSLEAQVQTDEVAPPVTTQERRQPSAQEPQARSQATARRRRRQRPRVPDVD